MSASTGIGPSTVVSRNEEPIAVEVDDAMVMMSIDQGMYFGLEGVGPRIWALLEQPRSVSDVCAALTQEFEIDTESCLRDVLGFLDELRQAQLIHVHGGTDGTTPSADRT